VAFPFGHGLSYTTFQLAALELAGVVTASAPAASAVPVLELHDDTVVTVALDVANVGPVAGAEVVQLYVCDEACSAYRPAQELKAFAKVRLEPGETRRMALELDRSAFAFWDAGSDGWLVEPGVFEIRVGTSSRDIRLRARLEVRCAVSAADGSAAGAPQPATGGPVIDRGGLACADETFAAMLGHPVPPPEPERPFHANSTLAEIGRTWLGARVRSRLVKQFLARMGAGTRDETLRRMFEEMANDMPLRALVLFSGGRLRFEDVEALVALLNGRFRQALGIWRRR
jgi:beta-glucosidase